MNNLESNMEIEKTVKEHRDVLLDALKGFAMVCVVLGHSIQFLNGVFYENNSMFWDNILFKFIYSFHMPLFAVISGYLFHISFNKHSFYTNLKNKSIQLLLPIFVFFLLTMFLETTIGILKYHDTSLIVRSAISSFANLWFLWSIFLGFLLTTIMATMCNKLAQEILFIGLVIVLLYSINLLHFYGVSKFVIIYFMLGYLIHEYINQISQLFVSSTNASRQMLLVGGGISANLFG